MQSCKDPTRPREDDVFDEAEHLVVNACSTECWVIIFRSVNPCVPQEQRNPLFVQRRRWKKSPVIHLPLRLETALHSLCLKVKDQRPSIREPFHLYMWDGHACGQIWDASSRGMDELVISGVTEPTAREDEHDFKKYILISWEIYMIFNKVHEKQWRGNL